MLLIDVFVHMQHNCYEFVCGILLTFLIHTAMVTLRPWPRLHCHFCAHWCNVSIR